MVHFIDTLPETLIWSASVGGIVTAIIVCFINIFIMPFRKNREWNDAVNSGRVIVAKRIKYRYPTGDDYLTDNYVWGYYQYEYGNKKKRIMLRFPTVPPETLELYYKKNPAKAKTANSFGGMETGIGRIFLIMTLISFVIKVLGT